MQDRFLYVVAPENSGAEISWLYVLKAGYFLLVEFSKALGISTVQILLCFQTKTKIQIV